MNYWETTMKMIDHLHCHIDIVLMASVTLLGFMIASLSILKIVVPANITKERYLYSDILKWFKVAIYMLMIAMLLSTISFFFNAVDWMRYVSTLSYVVFLISIYPIVKSVRIIFLLEER